MHACHCKDYSRSAIMREAAAGNGLRAIEPGMPLPAGTGLSRRSFLARSSGLALAVFGGAALAPQAFDEGIADAMAAGPDTVLVSIFLSGGLDTLALLAPAEDTQYQSMRPDLRAAVNTGLRLQNAQSTTPLQWHPNAGPLKTLHEQGRLTVMPATGYTSPNQSHFTSRHFYEVGELNEHGLVGWMGRWLDRNGRPDNPLQGLSLDASLAPSLAAANVPTAAVSNPTGYRLNADNVGEYTTLLNQTFGNFGRLGTSDPGLATARSAAAQVIGVQESLKDVGGTTHPTPAGVVYDNNGFANKLRVLAKMLHMGLPIRCVAFDGPGGYDTHENQAQALVNNLTVLSNGLSDFQADIEARGIGHRVLTLVWSEFGRRPQQNGSGTDHGAAGASLLMGAPSIIAKQQQGEYTGVATLDRHGNLRHSTDFRAIYKTVLENWLGGDLTDVLPKANEFSNLGLIKA